MEVKIQSSVSVPDDRAVAGRLAAALRDGNPVENSVLIELLQRIAVRPTAMVDVPAFRPKPAPGQETAAELLEKMAQTFRERNAVYGDNYTMVGPVMAILFPAGVPVEVLRHDGFHLLELIVVKLSRFAISALTHEDSIHDAGVYCAMIEAILKQQKGGAA